ncbi:Protein ECERIFERUM 1 [Vitis vinifera]|uniref:Protein ECERIFERUM 1 n=1 Tax=Vitis vinifera TaxID=29760 RepID=A0A438G3R2_VITVI|nr:Protein ECERIFERUM 1 [Vitis vinifera]
MASNQVSSLTGLGSLLEASRALHNQIWISLARYRTAKGNNRIVDKSIEFEQVDRESNWDDQILLNGILFYVVYMILPGVAHIPYGEQMVYFLQFFFIWGLLNSYTTGYTEHCIIIIFTHAIILITIPRLSQSPSPLIPKMLFSIFPPLKYLMYTPSYHSLHHTQFRTNYSLFMPIYDYIYGTMDKSSDALYEKSLIRPEQLPHVVHLTHLVTPQSIYHLRLGFASLASKPYTYKCYGELYIHNNPKLKIKVVDGSSLAVAVVLNSIPKGTTQVLFRGNLTKVAYFIASALCQMDIQVATSRKDEYEQLNTKLKNIWVVGDGLTKEEQMKASTGTLFIPFSQFPPKRLRKDCLYHTTPAMMPPKSFQNIDSCENWLPRRAMSASRVAGVIHALEGWNVHECGNTMFNVEKIWEASLQHGFRPLTVPT